MRKRICEVFQVGSTIVCHALRQDRNWVLNGAEPIHVVGADSSDEELYNAISTCAHPKLWSKSGDWVMQRVQELLGYRDWSELLDRARLCSVELLDQHAKLTPHVVVDDCFVPAVEESVVVFFNPVDVATALREFSQPIGGE